MSFTNSFKKFILIFKPSSDYDVVMRNAIYFLLAMIFVLLVLPYIEIKGLMMRGETVEIVNGQEVRHSPLLTIRAPDIEIFKINQVILKELFFYILGAYAIKKVGKYMVIAIVCFSTYRTGGNVLEVLDKLHLEEDRTPAEIKADNTNSNKDSTNESN